MYDPALGKFTTIDPKAEEYFSWSPYNYCGGNPIRRVDINGEGWGDVLDYTQTGLDVAGMIPAVGNVADLANAGISAARGGYVGAGLSLTAAVPIVGIAAGAAKTVKGVVKIADKANDGAKVLSKAETLVKNKAVGKKAEELVMGNLSKEFKGDQVLEPVTGKFSDGKTTIFDNIVVDAKTGKNAGDAKGQTVNTNSTNTRTTRVKREDLQ